MGMRGFVKYNKNYISFGNSESNNGLKKNYYRTIFNFNYYQTPIDLSFKKSNYTLSINYFKKHFLLFDLKNGVFKNYLFFKENKATNKELDFCTECENISMIFPLKHNINLYDPKSTFNYNWDLIGTTLTPKIFKKEKIKILFGTKLSFFYDFMKTNLDLYFIIEIFESNFKDNDISFTQMNKLNYSFKFVVLNSDKLEYNFKSCIFFKYNF